MPPAVPLPLSTAARLLQSARQDVQRIRAGIKDMTDWESKRGGEVRAARQLIHDDVEGVWQLSTFERAEAQGLIAYADAVGKGQAEAAREFKIARLKMEGLKCNASFMSA